MKRFDLSKQVPARSALIVAVGFLLALTQSGCLVAGGYSSGGGWFIWPGSFGLLIIGLLLFLFLRRGR